MAKHIQLMIYEGFLAADVESRFTDGGTQVANFRFGSTNEYKKGDEKVKETTWIKAVAWGSLAKIVTEYCAKGSHVIVTGRLRPGKNGSPDVYEGKNGSGASYEMVVTEIRIIKGVAGDGHQTTAVLPDEDDMPF